MATTVTRHITALAAACVLAAGLSGCAAGSGATGAASTAGAGAGGTTRLSGTVTVFAAASLKSTFTNLARDFEAKNPGTKVTLNFAGSSDLATQITQGAPADVFAAADARSMAKLTDEGLVDGAPATFATNVLEIAVPPSNPASIGSFADLAKPGVKLVVCAPQVPCGAATGAVEKATGTTLAPASEESSVTDVLGKVTAGEADAGLVYVTDLKSAAGRVEGVAFPEAAGAVNSYPAAVLSNTKNSANARAFLELIGSPKGQQVLSDAGFGPGSP
jgi:molybdate transport system substrate-binding protein